MLADEDGPYMITSPVAPTQSTVALAKSYGQRGRMPRNEGKCRSLMEVFLKVSCKYLLMSHNER